MSITQPLYKHFVGQLPPLLERSCVVVSLIVVAALVQGFIFSGFDHNEHMYLAAAQMLRQGGALYSEFTYLQMPLLPWVYAGASALSGGDISWLVIGRSVSWFAWFVLTVLFVYQTYRSSRRMMVGIAAILVLGLNSTLLRAANESSNYILPAALLFVGSCFFGKKEPAAPFWAGLFFGLATSTKLFYLAFIPGLGIAFSRERWRPLLAGLLLGLALPLYYLVSSPDLFLFQNYGFHRLTTEWRAEQHVALGFTLKQRLDILGRWISRWDQGSLMFLALGALVMTTRRSSDRAHAARCYLFGISLPLAFVSAPVYEQYLSLPVLGSLVLLANAFADPRLCWGLVIAAVAHVAHDRHGILRFIDRKPVQQEFQSVCREISKKIGSTRSAAATLSPLYALECGIAIYPEFATGPFLYRIMDRIEPAEPTRNRAVSPSELYHFLDSRRPDIIITGKEGRLDTRFDQYARDHRYKLIVSRSKVRVYRHEDVAVS